MEGFGVLSVRLACDVLLSLGMREHSESGVVLSGCWLICYVFVGFDLFGCILGYLFSCFADLFAVF